MALFKLNDFIDYHTHGSITEISWQVALDSGFTQIIEESIKDHVNVREWYSMLPVIGATDGSCYADLSNVYARVKIHIGLVDSDWFDMVPLNQNNQIIFVTELNNTTTTYDALADNFN